MRNDFNKVLTERPRQGHKRKHKEVRKAYNSKFNVNYDNDEDGPLGGTEHMRRPYQNWDTRKNNTDLWSAIRRFMLSRVGRLWDDVWSEVNRDLRESDDMRAHWRVHCKIEVDDKVIVDPATGRLVRPRGPDTYTHWDRWSEDTIHGVRKRFYVDPRDGILKKTPEGKFIGPRYSYDSERDPAPYGYDMGDGISIKYIDGVWYDVAYTPYEASETYEKWYGNRDENGVPIYVTKTRLVTKYHYKKRQLNTRELVKYGVRNA